MRPIRRSRTGRCRSRSRRETQGWWRSIGGRAPRPSRGVRGARDGASISRSGIPRSWCTTAGDGRTTRSIPRASSTASSPHTMCCSTCPRTKSSGPPVWWSKATRDGSTPRPIPGCGSITSAAGTGRAPPGRGVARWRPDVSACISTPNRSITSPSRSTRATGTTKGATATSWREAFLDEGFTSFQTGWFFERRGGRPAYPALEADVLMLDLARWSEPVSLPSERFRDFFTYNQMVYAKAQLFYEQLRYVVGDETMRRILRAYYARWKLKHVDEEAFREVAEQVSRQDLKWLFGQWLHGTPLIDYALKHVQRTRQADGRWLTGVAIERKGDGFMPVEIGTQGRRGAGDTGYAPATGQPARERVEFTTD